MTRRATLVFALLLVAAAVGFEPVLHTHPLTQSSPAPCAVCVSAVGRVPSLVAVPMAPIAAIPATIDPITRLSARDAGDPLASRAPPAA